MLSSFFYFSPSTFTLVLCNLPMCILNLHMLSARIIQHIFEYFERVVFFKFEVLFNVDHATEKTTSMLNKYCAGGQSRVIKGSEKGYKGDMLTAILQGC